MSELWSAILNPHGPNYETWSQVFGSERVPLKSCVTVLADLGPEKDVPVHMLNLQALTLKQRAQLLGIIALKLGVSIYEVEAEIAAKGFPIRAADVIVSMSLRGFL